MKKIEAIIDPIALGEVRQALEEIGLTDLILSDVRGTDQHGTYTEIFRGVEYKVDFVLRLKLEAIVDDGCVDEIAEAITKAAAATPDGVSQVFIYPIEKIATSTGDGPESFP
jgi:nitrogen regulatory protein P-II 1